MNLRKNFRKIMIVTLLTSSVALISCSQKLCSANLTSGDRSRYREYLKYGTKEGQHIAPPYTDNYKAQLEKNYSGRR